MNATPRTRILLADDHRMVAEGLKSLLSAEFDLVGVVEDGCALVDAAARLHPDVIVADIAMPRLGGLEAVALIRKADPRIKVVFLSMHQEAAYVRRAFEIGAAGYVLKHSAPAELIDAIRAALAGKTYVTPALAGAVIQAIQTGADGGADPASRLTPRQRQILQLLAEGRSAKEVAGTLGISSRTVEFHKYHMMESLGLHSSAELIGFAIKHGIVSI